MEAEDAGHATGACMDRLLRCGGCSGVLCIDELSGDLVRQSGPHFRGSDSQFVAAEHMRQMSALLPRARSVVQTIFEGDTLLSVSLCTRLKVEYIIAPDDLAQSGLAIITVQSTYEDPAAARQQAVYSPSLHVMAASIGADWLFGGADE